MSSPPDPTSSKVGVDTLLSSLRAVAGDALKYLELKLRLASVEGSEAGRRYAKALSLSALGAVLLGAADLFACAALISLLTDLIRPLWEAVRWEYLALLVALLHVLAGICLLKSAKSSASHDVFPDTIDQLNKDREWLKKTTETQS